MKNRWMEFRDSISSKLIVLFGGLKGRVANEKGVSTIEWIGLAAVIIALMFAVAGAMSENGSDLAKAIVGKIKEMIESINS